MSLLDQWTNLRVEVEVLLGPWEPLVPSRYRAEGWMRTDARGTPRLEVYRSIPYHAEGTPPPPPDEVWTFHGLGPGAVDGLFAANGTQELRDNRWITRCIGTPDGAPPPELPPEELRIMLDNWARSVGWRLFDDPSSAGLPRRPTLSGVIGGDA